MTSFDTHSDNIEQTRIMGGSPAAERRVLKHRRTFCYEVYERADGLWDIDAQMLDHKNHEMTIANQRRAVGEALHNMIFRLTLDDAMTILAVQTTVLSAPYIMQCPKIASAYEQLVGLNVLKGFRQAVKERFAKTAGCTHLTELANTLPTVAVQGIGTELAARRQLSGHDSKPFQLDQCHALSSDGEMARLYYPTWYTGT